MSLQASIILIFENAVDPKRIDADLQKITSANFEVRLINLNPKYEHFEIVKWWENVISLKYNNTEYTLNIAYILDKNQGVNIILHAIIEIYTGQFYELLNEEPIKENLVFQQLAQLFLKNLSYCKAVVFEGVNAFEDLSDNVLLDLCKNNKLSTLNAYNYMYYSK